MDGVNSDLAFTGNYAIQGNYNGYQVWDISNPGKPTLKIGVRLPGVAERRLGLQEPAVRFRRGARRARIDCGAEGVQGHRERRSGCAASASSTSATSRTRSTSPTCRPAAARTRTRCWSTRRTRTTSTSTSPARPASARRASLPGCVRATPDQDPNSALFRIEVIKVPLAHPEQAAIVSSPRIFNDLAAPPRARRDAAGQTSPSAKALADAQGGGRLHRRRSAARSVVLPPQLHQPDARQHRQGARTAPARRPPPTAQRCAPRCPASSPSWSARSRRRAPVRPGPTSATTSRVYPAIGLAGGACAGYGLLLDIRDPAHPDAHRRRGRLELLVLALGDVQQRRHQGPVLRRVGRRRRSRSAARPTRRTGAPTRSSRSRTARWTSRATTRCRRRRRRNENCVAHNGSLIPIPGRDVMVQAWYQGGISVFDWTDAAHPKEIAFFDRGPMDSTQHGDGRLVVGVLVQRRTSSAPRSRAASTSSSCTPSAVHLAERDRRGEVGALRLPQRRRTSRSSSGRRASRWRGPTSTSSSGRRGWRQPDRIHAAGADECREVVGGRARGCAQPAGDPAGGRRGQGRRPGQGEDARGDGEGAGDREELSERKSRAAPPASSCRRHSILH